MQDVGTQNWPQQSQKNQTAWSDLFHIFPPSLALLKGKRNAEVSFASGHDFYGRAAAAAAAAVSKRTVFRSDALLKGGG